MANEFPTHRKVEKAVASALAAAFTTASVAHTVQAGVRAGAYAEPCAVVRCDSSAVLGQGTRQHEVEVVVEIRSHAVDTTQAAHDLAAYVAETTFHETTALVAVAGGLALQVFAIFPQSLGDDEADERWITRVVFRVVAVHV